jgi:2,3-bisphosphoglycerate-dependent phosphoglycerate mutase
VKPYQSATRLIALLTLVLLTASGYAQRPGTPILRIYLARHGQTDWNLEGRTQGQTDTPLNATGRRQAEELKSLLVGTSLDAVYSSTLSRSRETAEIVHGNTPVTNLPGLRERNFGKFQGRLERDPQTGPEFQKRRTVVDDSLDGGESLTAFFERVRAAMDNIRKQRPSGTILIVGHLETNRMILRSLLGLTFEQAMSIMQDNNELYMIELEQGRNPRLWKLVGARNLKDL